MITRRHLMVSAAAAGAVTSLASGRSWAGANMKLGSAQIDIVSDGHLQLPVSMVLGRVPDADRDAFLKANPIEGSTVKSPLNLTLFSDGERTVLFDVGSGPNFMSSAGKIAEALDAIGVAPDDITHVLFTHAHPDHIWGVKDDFDEEVFSNAEYHMSQAEWDYWFDPETVNKVPEERQSFAVGAKNNMEVIKDKTTRFKPGSEVRAGHRGLRHVRSHTRPHLIRVHNGSESVMVVGDVITNAAYSFSNPEWEMGTDSDPAQGVKARKALLDRLATDKTHMIGYHLPHPGLGYVEKKNGAYTYTGG
jgi:glyoxylase-like metal-dependent hydrolase (beta-lactamase superfamily II)